MRYLSGNAVLLIVCSFLLLQPAQGLPQVGRQAAVDQKELPADEKGLPFFAAHYSSREYQANPQNWAVAQDPRGIIYVANLDGVLQYDGAYWRLIRTANNSAAVSLDVAADGTVYVGAQGDLGYLQPDSTGTLQYVSLLDHLAPVDQDFAEVWGTHATSAAVYFQSKTRIFRWDGLQMQVWHSEAGFHTSFVVHDQFFVRQPGEGLFVVEGDALQRMPEGAFFAERPVHTMVPYDEARVLIGTVSDGFFLYDGRTLEPFPTEVDDFVEGSLYHGCALPGNTFALATLGGGVVIIDAEGRLRQVLNESAGLPDDWVNFVYLDAQGGLWMAFDSRGVMRVDVQSALTLYDHRLGLDGMVQDILRHEETLYVATSTGLYRLEERPLSPASEALRTTFEKVPGMPTTLALASQDGQLLAATSEGIYRVQEDAITKLTSGAALTLLPSAQYEGTVYVGMRQGLGRLRHSAAGWTMEQSVGPVQGQVHSLAEEGDGTLWLSTLQNGLWRLRFPEGGAAAPDAEQLDAASGVPSGRIVVSTLEGRVILATRTGLLRYRETATGAPGFVSDSAFAAVNESSEALRSLFVDEAENIWMVYSERVDIARRQADASYRIETPDVLRFPKALLPHVYSEPGGITWLGNGDVLVRYDPSQLPVADQTFPVLIRRVTVVDRETPIFGGVAGSVAEAVLPYEQNNLHIEYALPSFLGTGGSTYQYLLEGRDRLWSPWTTQTSETFADLQEGTYRFRVRARNLQGLMGPEAVFTFRLLPPWYRTVWAYLLYLTTLTLVGVLTYRYRKVVKENKRAQEQARELARERLVNERLHQANRRLQEANESLLQADKMKDEFLANTSHELRTPITAILGFSTILKEELSTQHHEFVEIIEDSGNRLLHTVNELLDFARLRSGKMELHYEPVNVGEQVRQVIRLLEPLAKKKQLVLTSAEPERPAYAWLDQHYFVRVLHNLISNAIKFTDEGGVTVEVEEDGGAVHVHVRDTGIGIEQSFLPHLFEAFKQESEGLTRSHEGSGLGLAITAELVALMQGKIEVESAKGRGSVFTVSFPASRKHVPAEEQAAQREA